MIGRVGVRYEVALDLVGGVLSHLSEMTAREREASAPAPERLRALVALRECVRDLRDALDPVGDPQGIEVTISRFRPLARAAFGHDQISPEQRLERTRQFEQIEASMGLEGLAASAADELLRQLVADGVIDAELAVAAYRRMSVEVLQLSARDQETMARALIDPPALAPALESAMKRHSSLLREDDQRER